MDPATENSASDTPNFAPRLYGIGALVAIIVFVGGALITSFTASDLARDMQSWQEKLNLIAESRNADVEQWVADNFKELRTLADNPSLQLYLTALQSGPSEGGGNYEPAQKTYLRNLLIFTAGRAGFGAAGNPENIPADIEPQGKGGLAILNNHNDIVVSTPMLAATRDLIMKQAATLAAGKETLIDISKDDSGALFIGFSVPIYSIQGDHTADAQMGRIVGIKTVDNNLFGLLKHPGITEKTLEAILVRKSGDQLEYISPLEDGTSALSKENPLDADRFVSAQLMKIPGNFIGDQKDYRGKTVLATSRVVADTPWLMIVKIDRAEAFAASDQRRAGMIVVLCLAIAVIVLIIITVWWHAHSKRAMMMSHHFRLLAAQAMAQEKLLRLVADNQPEPIYIVDKELTYRFANRKTAEAAHMSPDTVPGKTLNDIYGAARAERVKEQCLHVFKHRQIAYDMQRVQEGGEQKVMRSIFVPIDHIPLVSLPDPTPGVLVVEQDISEVVHEREQRMATLQQLVMTLVALVDKRDPFAANHSLLVSHLAGQVAADMALDQVTVETTRAAGSLLNIGKIVVPPELLTKTGALTDAEKAIIRDSMNAAAELIKDIHFDGPVAETLRQWQEKWDGSGAMGLKGEEILISARIIAAANSFIGMISPRSWRHAIPIEAATQFLLDESNTHFDQRVAVALVNYVENQNGRQWLKKILEGQKDLN